MGSRAIFLGFAALSWFLTIRLYFSFRSFSLPALYLSVVPRIFLSWRSSASTAILSSSLCFFSSPVLCLFSAMAFSIVLISATILASSLDISAGVSFFSFFFFFFVVLGGLAAESLPSSFAFLTFSSIFLSSSARMASSTWYATRAASAFTGPLFTSFSIIESILMISLSASTALVKTCQSLKLVAMSKPKRMRMVPSMEYILTFETSTSWLCLLRLIFCSCDRSTAVSSSPAATSAISPVRVGPAAPRQKSCTVDFSPIWPDLPSSTRWAKRASEQRICFWIKATPLATKTGRAPGRERAREPRRMRMWLGARTLPPRDGATSTCRLSARAGSSIRTAATKAYVASAVRGNGGDRKVVVLGGAGRVGSATAAAIVRERESDARLTGTRVVLAGRRPEEEALGDISQQLASRVQYERCDIEDPASLDRVLGGGDCALVIHAAGPFQQTKSCSVLEAAIRNKVGGYIDVCDDAEHTSRAKVDLGDMARASGVPAVVSCGVYPGLSNVMASYMCGEGSPFPENKPTKLRFSYFTAGSGGVGATILATSVLLLGEKATQFLDGREVAIDPYSQRTVVEFGQKIGKREVFSLNLPEVFTCHEALGVPSVSAYFGTSPGVWNFMMQKMAEILPESLLQSRQFANGLAQVIMPLVVAVDKLVGKTTAMRIDVKYDNDKTSSSLFVHEDTAYTAGASTAAFAAAVLGGKVPPGVHYPEDECVVQDYEAFFRMASSEAATLAVAQAPWRLERTELKLGLGLYL